jgi:hypothetical protein
VETGTGWDRGFTDIVVLGDQGVDGAGTQDEVFGQVLLVGLPWRLAFVVLVLEDGDVCFDDVVAVVLGQGAFVLTIVDVAVVDVDGFVVSFGEADVLTGVDFAVVYGTNGGGDREGEEGGEEKELHVGLSR